MTRFAYRHTFKNGLRSTVVIGVPTLILLDHLFIQTKNGAVKYWLLKDRQLEVGMQHN